MAEAKKIADETSTDLLQPTGAVVVKDGLIVGRGSNQTPLPTNFLRVLHKNGLCVRKKLYVKSGTKYWLCPGCAKAHHHGESRAVRNALDSGYDLHGAELYLWGHWWVCKPCWDTMLAAGISTVYLLDGSDELFNPKSPKSVIGK
jgi:deoxycytidylate deaminase